MDTGSVPEALASLAPHLLLETGMSPVTKKWLRVLESKFRVGSDFSTHLEPLLRHLDAQKLNDDQLKEILCGIAAAYRSCEHSSENDSLGEVRVLLGQFVTEMKKLDETLKVLSVYLERVRQRIHRPTPGRTLH
jgi:hypothetical protein